MHTHCAPGILRRLRHEQSAQSPVLLEWLPILITAAFLSVVLRQKLHAPLLLLTLMNAFQTELVR
jgi:hypothetical protein